MNGSNYLLDTNFILGILKSNPVVVAEVSSRSVYTSECFYMCCYTNGIVGLSWDYG
jgi:predicted nucleic acid-binding protein